MKLKKFKHIDLSEAKKLFGKSHNNLFKITTINWTYVNRKKLTDFSKVHYNEYETSLYNLIKWIVYCFKDVAEDIIDIEKIGGSDNDRQSKRPNQDIYRKSEQRNMF